MAIDKSDWERLRSDCLNHLTGASQAGIKGELYNTLHELFNDASCWWEVLSVPVLPGVLDYNVVPTEGGMIIRLAGVSDGNNIPQPAVMPTLGTVSILWPVNTAQTFSVTVVKNVSTTTSDNLPDVPDWVLKLFYRTVLDGVLGKMMLQQNKSYTNDTLGTYHLKRFRDGIAMARVATLKRNTFGAQAWAYPQGFKTKTQRGGVSVGNTAEF